MIKNRKSHKSMLNLLVTLIFFIFVFFIFHTLRSCICSLTSISNNYIFTISFFSIFCKLWNFSFLYRNTRLLLIRDWRREWLRLQLALTSISRVHAVVVINSVYIKTRYLRNTHAVYLRGWRWWNVKIDHLEH